MARTLETFTKQQIDEVFSHPAIREVAFEIRFAARLRVNAELWKLQDQLVEQYPNTGTESAMQPNAAILTVNVFQNALAGRVIKVSQENFVIAFTRYSRFEDFKEEVVNRTSTFCATFGVKSLTRVGLRYVNEITVPVGEPPSSLLRFVRPLIDFDRIEIESVEQFADEIRVRHKDHMVTLRGVLLPSLETRPRTYVLDIDCYSPSVHAEGEVPRLLEDYHDSAQRFFLDHITEDYKEVMRGRR